MINEKLRQLISELSSHGIIISFNGSFTQKIIEEFGSAITAYLQAEKTADAIDSHTVFSVYIEQAQNIKNYFLRRSAGKNSCEIRRRAFESIIVIGRQDKHFFVCSGNQIHNDDIHKVKKHIDHINSLSKEQLKKVYKETLKATPPLSASAGLGIIDMARKAVLPLEYMVTTRDADFSFFTLKVNL